MEIERSPQEWLNRVLIHNVQYWCTKEMEIPFAHLYEIIENK